jgi:hypothetical protein
MYRSHASDRLMDPERTGSLADRATLQRLEVGGDQRHPKEQARDVHQRRRDVLGLRRAKLPGSVLTEFPAIGIFDPLGQMRVRHGPKPLSEHP